MICVTDWVENIVGKGEKCWFPAFSPFHNVFKRPLLQGCCKSGSCGKE